MASKYPSLNAGTLRKRGKLFKPHVGVDLLNNTVQEFKYIKTLWIDIDYKNTKYVLIKDEKQGFNETVIITCRYQEGIAREDRIVYKDEVYVINGVENKDYRERVLVLNCSKIDDVGFNYKL